MSAITERARDFWDRISPRERGMVVIAAVAAPIILVVWLGLAISDGLTNMQARNDKMRKALAALIDLKAHGPAKPADDTIEKMPVEPLSLDTYLSNAAKDAGFTLKGTTPRNPVSRNGFVTNSVSLTVSDVNIDELQKFLAAIETKSKYVAITHLDVQRRDYKGKDKLDASLDVSTYSKEAKDAKAAGSDAGSAAGSAGSGGN
ncbi:MAG TPA: type II secretion system protein GspM [Kofleriaceae bacterium]|nr:type II secretion system protein GspM [Kofleriaceae bacterium]